jgi:hypothetical protein
MWAHRIAAGEYVQDAFDGEIAGDWVIVEFRRTPFCTYFHKCLVALRLY